MPAAKRRIGKHQQLRFTETNAKQPEYDGHHIQIYIADFSKPYKWLLDRGLVTMETDPCPCGRPYPLIRAIEGRGDELILLQDSNGRPARAHSVNFVLPIEALGGVKQHQVLQDEDGLHVVVVPKGGVAREALAAEVIAVLRRQLETRGFRLPSVDVRFSSVLPGDPSAGGKLRPVVSTLTGPLARTHE